MKCPICYHPDTKVINSRAAGDGLSVRRRRECSKCSFRFSTYEEIEILDLTVVKQDGDKESYNREKLVKGLEKSLEKRPINKDKFKKLIHCIERDIQKQEKNEISSSFIGEAVMKYLKRIDKVAYIRFASVYESFQDAQAFREELNKILKTKKKKINSNKNKKKL